MGENVFLENAGASSGREVGNVLFDCSGAVVEGNFNVNVKGLKGEGKTADATEGVNCSELGWERRR